QTAVTEVKPWAPRLKTPPGRSSSPGVLTTSGVHMKKTLLSLAILGAFSGTAAAQTSVSLYGIADVGIGVADTDAAGSDSVVNVFSGVQSSSRFGIRGTEDLGGGLKATFNIEAGVNWDTGSAASNTQFWGRRA